MISTHIVHAFTDTVFKGNPAAVCLLDNWLDDKQMQAIATENNLPETAYVVAEGNAYHIRWFTPSVEVPLCGHATLAAAYVLFNIENLNSDHIEFNSHSGPLQVGRQGELIELNFPAQKLSRIAIESEIKAATASQPDEVYLSDIFTMAVFRDQQSIASIKPDLTQIENLPASAFIATAPGDSVDFVSRMFAPKLGIDEDPVTGSAHCALTPYWRERLGKQNLSARQISTRGGELQCSMDGQRVLISGRASLYLSGTVFI